MGRFDVEQISEWQKGYLVGFFVGDGCLNFRSKYYSYITKFALNASSERAIANFLVSILLRAHTKPRVTIKGNRLDIRISSKGLYLFLKMHAGYESEDGKLRKRLLSNDIWTEEFMLGILAGLIDSDGCVAYDKKKYLRAVISTRSKVLASSMLQLTERLRIKAMIHQSSGFTVRISTPSLKANAPRIRSLKLEQKFK